MLLGELILEYREKHKMSQRQFAKKCGGISNGYVSMLENNLNPATNKGITPKIDKLHCIANGMDMTLQELMTAVDDMNVDLSYDDEEVDTNHTSENTNRSTGISTTGSISELSYKAMDIARFYDELPRDAQEFIDQAFKLAKWYIEK